MFAENPLGICLGQEQCYPSGFYLHRGTLRDVQNGNVHADWKTSL